MLENKSIMLLGETINYIYEETGKVKVLFLHGFNSSLKFAAEIYKLERNFDIVAFDFPGCGKSSAHNPINIEFYQNITLVFIEQLRLKDFYIVAHSLGGASALKALEKNSTIKHAILGAPINHMLIKDNDIVSLLKLKSWLLPDKIEDAIESTDSLVYRPIATYKSSISNIAKAFLKIVARKKILFHEIVENQILNPQYLETKIKALYDNAPANYSFIIGDHDLFVSKKAIDKIALEKNKIVHTIPLCGHAPFYEYPEEVLQIIEKTIVKNEINN